MKEENHKTETYFEAGEDNKKLEEQKVEQEEEDT